MLVASIYILVLLIFALIAFAVMQIKLAGLNVKDFISFIKANDMLDKLYNFVLLIILIFVYYSKKLNKKYELYLLYNFFDQHII